MGYNCQIHIICNWHELKKANPTQFTEGKTGTVVFTLFNFQNYRKFNNSLQTYFREVLGLKRVDSNQSESGVFSRKLQFQSIWVDSNQPALVAV